LDNKGGTMRRGGLALVVIVLVGALSRTWAPQTQPAIAAPQNSVPAVTSPGNLAATGSAGTETPRGPFRDKIQEKIRTFFSHGLAPGTPCADTDQYYCVPQDRKIDIRFVIAIVPDPIHSHLSHFFDSAIESIEQGAFNEGYAFDRAIMPWPYAVTSPITGGTSPITVEVSSKGKEGDPKRREKEAPVSPDSFPGLMIFREGEIRLTARYGYPDIPNPSFNQQAEPLFVFVVGETPTAGINEDQFRNAVDIIRAIRKGVQSAQPEFGVLGPTFTGSLYSLRALLQDGENTARIPPIYGTVLGTTTIKWFQNEMPRSMHMVLFQQDSSTALKALKKFAGSLGYKDSEIGVLAEDETAYGSSTQPDPTRPASEVEVNLSFPRGISQLRSEYSKEISNQAAAANSNPQPQTNLRLDLEMTGSDDDSVAPYAKGQTAVGQEAIMRAIVSELHRREVKFILLRASDPLDELFLASYLHDKYSQARLFVPTPDLLFAREANAPLSGVLGLSTYPLEPAPLNPRCPGFGSEEIFGASHNAGLYNATTALIQELGRLKSDPLDMRPDDNVASGSKQRLDDSPCKLSSNLWLTVISGNAIRPIKVLEMSASPFFPVSEKTPPKDEDPSKVQFDARTPLTWVFAYIACLAFMFRHARLSWTGGDFGMWQTAGQLKEPDQPLGKNGSEPGSRDRSYRKKGWILWLGGLLLVAILVVLTSPWTPITRAEWAWPAWTRLLLWIPLPLFVTAIGKNFWGPRKKPVPAVFFVVASVLMAALGIFYAAYAGPEMVLWQQRILDLTSGTSSATPLLFLLVAMYVWFWYAFRAEGLFDWRRPKLPPDKKLPKAYYNLREEVAEDVREAITIETTTTLQPLSLPWVLAVSFTAVVCIALPAIVLGPGHMPIRSLEGLFFDGVYFFLLGITLFMLVATLLRLLDLWWRFSGILTAMDRAGLREATTRLKGFEWNVIWNPALSVTNEEHKLVLRKIQILECLLAEIDEDAEGKTPQHTELKTVINRIMTLRGTIIDKISKPPSPSDAKIDSDIMPEFIELQAKFAEAAELLLNDHLDEHWKRSCLTAEAVSCGQPAEESSSISIKPGIATATIRITSTGNAPSDPTRLSKNALRLAEDFVASVYATFLVTVLLSIRGLVFTAVTAYACIVLSTVSYPFTPAPSLTILAVVLFTLSGIIIWYIYEEMHRDATLSRMTSTEPGKLDAAFWTKILSVGLVPLLTLMTSLFPQSGHLLYTLVEPILQALR
jgi:hypothetical protein